MKLVVGYIESTIPAYSSPDLPDELCVQTQEPLLFVARCTSGAQFAHLFFELHSLTFSAPIQESDLRHRLLCREYRE